MTPLRSCDGMLHVVDNAFHFTELVEAYIGTEAAEWYTNSLQSLEDEIGDIVFNFNCWIEDHANDLTPEMIHELRIGPLLRLHDLDVRAE